LRATLHSLNNASDNLRYVKFAGFHYVVSETVRETSVCSYVSVLSVVSPHEALGDERAAYPYHPRKTRPGFARLLPLTNFVVPIRADDQINLPT
jgi:hypothetical protein